MIWLWQGIIITVLCGIILAIIILLSKMVHEIIKSAKRLLTPGKIKVVEDTIMAKRKSYKTAGSFYEDLEDASWIKQVPGLDTISNRNRKKLKTKWLQDADFTISYDHTNIDLMRLQTVADRLTKRDLDSIISKPTKDNYGNNQAAGNLIFMQFMKASYPRRISRKVARWMKAEEEE
jgi:hypothetical protein